ncbi:MAG: metal-dependent hydrolase [Actinomycetota bacterium]
MLFWHLGVTVAVIFVTLGRRRIDYRVVLLGAILPDLIDKPVGRIFFESSFETSRLFGHTLLFPLALLLGIQILLREERARRWFVLPIAALVHVGLDGMWGDPITLFWPLFGWEFPRVPVRSYWWEVLLRPIQHPLEAAKEVVGLILLAYLGYAFDLYKSPPRRRFLRNGRLASAREAERSGFEGGGEG